MRGARVLVVDDDEDTCDLLQVELGRQGYEVTTCTTGIEALQQLNELEFNAVLTDLAMAGMSGLELCERIVACQPAVPVLVLTGNGSLETAIGALRMGAYDFITKPLELAAMKIALDRAIQHQALATEVQRLRRVVSASESFGDFQGKSAPMLRLFDLLERAAQTDASVLLIGESGTGKELAARALHARSRRKSRPFVALNCAAMPETLLESELFGHVRGAFTDASADRQGLLVSANGGTVFLDEVGDMPAGVQPKLLRALEERTVRPIGAGKEIPFDTRIVAATHRDLAAAVDAGTFRADLFFRLNVIEMNLPPLRVRGTDILLLAQKFLNRYAELDDRAVTGFTPAVAQRLLDYRWPGNVRELKNCIERAVALTRTAELTVDDLPPAIQAFQAHRATEDRVGPPDSLVPLEVIERAHVERVLDVVHGNKREAARILGLDRKTLYRKLEKWAAPPSAPALPASERAEPAG